MDQGNPDCVTLPCNHVFHSQCIDDWRNRQVCPHNIFTLFLSLNHSIQPEQQEVTCPNCRHGIQQESMQEIMRPFEYLDLVLIPVMLTVSKHTQPSLHFIFIDNHTYMGRTECSHYPSTKSGHQSMGRDNIIMQFAIRSYIQIGHSIHHQEMYLISN